VLPEAPAGRCKRDNVAGLTAWVLAVADDLTGALEAGAKFAGNGMRARVITEREIESAPDVPVLVIDSETRHAGADCAAAVVRLIAREGRRRGAALVYKKTDSTLRGNIAAELGAVLEEFPDRPAVYVPAYPEVGRTVMGGRLHVHGVPVHQTDFASDPLNPVRESHIGRMLGGLPVSVIDGETPGDVERAAERIANSDPLPIAAGPAGLAEALALRLRLPRTARRPWPRLSRCLVVNGSLHPVSRCQLERAVKAGLGLCGWTLMDVSAESDVSAGMERAHRTGERVRNLLAQSEFDGVVVFGGDTAFGIHHALGHPPFDPYGEVVPGVPLSACGGRFWITKAGGFGGPSLLCDLQRILA